MTERYSQMRRRDFLRAGAGLAAAAGLPGMATGEDAGWSEVPGVLANIKAPVFPEREFDITRYGAAPDGKTDCGEAIARAMAACHSAGGGSVIIPPGSFLTGPIHLRSNVNLHVSAGATLLFARDPQRYLPAVYTRWEGVECMNYSPFIYADGQENIAVTGEGTLDGQADCDHWWAWTGRTNCGWSKGQPNQKAARDRLFEMGQSDVPVCDRVFGEGGYLRPCFIQPCQSRNVLIEGVTIVNSPMYEINPVLCRNVTVRGVRIASHGPNNDGCDPDSCSGVLIENCSFDTGDDCIAIKSGRNRDGRRVGMPSENLVIRGCEMKDGHGGVTIGSEMSGGVRSVFVEGCRLSSPNLNEALRFKTNAMRGGTIEHIFFRNLTIGQVADAVLQIDFQYEEGEKGPERPIVRDIDIRNVTCEKSQYALQLRGFASSPIRDIRIEDCTFSHVARPDVIEHVEGLRMANVTVNGKAVTVS